MKNPQAEQLANKWIAELLEMGYSYSEMQTVFSLAREKYNALNKAQPNRPKTTSALMSNEDCSFENMDDYPVFCGSNDGVEVWAIIACFLLLAWVAYGVFYV